MVVKNKVPGKLAKNKKAKVTINKKVRQDKEEDESEGLSLDDAFADDDDVEYAESKPRKIEKEVEDDEEVSDLSRNSMDEDLGKKRNVRASKLVEKIKKGDKIRVDGKEYEVDAHYVLIDHGSTKEMAIELFDKNDRDFQIRYFADQMETTIEFYELQEIIYVKRKFDKIEW